MGCWNGTCMISNLHIKYGQKIVVLMLVRKTGYYSTCYSNTFYDACPMPFYGEYNDYGGAENCHGPLLDKLVSTIRRDLCEMPEGDNKYHDRAVSKHGFDLEALFRAEQDDRLGIVNLRSRMFSEDDKNSIAQAVGTVDQETQDKLDRLYIALAKPDLSQSMIKIQKVFIHGDIFDAIMNNFYIEEYKGEGKGTAGYGNWYDHVYFKDVQATIPAFIDLLKLKVKEPTFENEDTEFLIGSVIGRIRIKAALGESDILAAKYLGWFESSDSPRALINVIEEIVQYTQKQEWDLLAVFCEEVLKVLWLNAYLEHTRKAWIVTTGSGGQGQEHLGYRVLINAMSKVLDNERADSDDEEDTPLEEQVSTNLIRFSKELEEMEQSDKEFLTPEKVSTTVDLLNKAATLLYTK